MMNEEESIMRTVSGRRLAQSVIAAMMVMFVCISVSFASDPGKVRSVNHKGYNTIAPENTLPAYELSKQHGFQYVETDISFTKDDVPVLLHNASIGQMARHLDGSELTQEEDKDIGELTYEFVHDNYDFTQGKEAYKGTKIAKMDEFLDLCKDKGLHPYLELKENGDYSQEQIVQLVDLVRTKGMEGKVTWISFSEKYLQWVKTADSHARLGILGIAADDVALKEYIAQAKKLQTGSNEVFLDLDIHLFKGASALCRKEGLPLEVWMFVIPGMFEEKDMLEALDDSYVSGITMDQYKYAQPDQVALSKTSYVYDGKAKKPGVTATWNGTALVNGKTCKVTYDEDCKSAGTHTVKVSLIQKEFAGAKTVTYEIRQAANPLAVKGKTAIIKYQTLKKKTQTLKAAKAISFTQKGQGALSCKLVSVKKAKFAKFFKVNSRTGDLTVRKGLKKGTYEVKLSIRAAGNRNYEASAAKTVIAKIVVK